MSASLVHVGFGNYIVYERVRAVDTPHSAPVQRLIREGKKQGIVIDVTSGRRTKAAVFTDTGRVLLVAISPNALKARAEAARSGRVAQAQAD